MKTALVLVSSAAVGLLGGAMAQSLPAKFGDLRIAAQGEVHALAEQADGKILVAGDFDSVNGFPRGNLARISRDGHADLSWSCEVDGPVFDLLVDGSDLYLAGDFSTVDGIAVEDFAKVSLEDGSVDSAFPAVLFENAPPEANYELFTGLANPFDLSGHSIDLIPDGAGGYSYGTIDEGAWAGTAVELQTLGDPGDAAERVVLTGETFEFFGTAYGCFWVNENGTINFDAASADATETPEEHFMRRQIALLWHDLAPGFGQVFVTQADDRVAVEFFEVPEEGMPASRNNATAELFFDGRIRLSFGMVDLTDVLVGISPGGLVHDPVAHGSIDFSEQDELREGLHREALSLAASDSDVFVGSDSGRIRKVNKAGGLPDGSWEPAGRSQPVEALGVEGSWLFAGFGTSGVGRISTSGTGGEDMSFAATSPADLAVRGLDLDGGDLVVVPGLVGAAIQPVKLDSGTGARDTSWLPEFIDSDDGSAGAYPSKVREVAIHDGWVYLGGQFEGMVNSDGGGGVEVASRSVARVSLAGDGAADEGWSSRISRRRGDDSAPDPVFAVLPGEAGVLVGGSITAVGPDARLGLTRLVEVSGAIDRSFLAMVERSDASIRALVEQRDGKLLVGGDFLTIGGLARRYLARFNSDGSLDSTWVSHSPSPVDHLAIGGSRLYAALESWNSLVRIDLVTGARTDLEQLGSDSAGTTVLSLESSNERIYYSHLGEYADSRQVIDLPGSPSISWVPEAFPHQPIERVLATEGRTLYVVRDDGSNPPSIRRYDEDGDDGIAWETTADPGMLAAASIAALAVDGSHVYALGRVGEVGGTGVGSLFRLDKDDGALDAGWLPSVGVPAAREGALALTDSAAWMTSDDVLLGVELASATLSDAPEIDGPVRTLLAYQGGIVAGGDFSMINGARAIDLGMLKPAAAPVVGLDEDGRILVVREPRNGDEVTHFRIDQILGGSLFLADGTTRIDGGDFITVAQGLEGLVWVPDIVGLVREIRVGAAFGEGLDTFGADLTSFDPASLGPLILFESFDFSAFEDAGSMEIRVRYTGSEAAAIDISVARGTARPVNFTTSPVGDYFDPGTQTIHFSEAGVEALVVALWDDDEVEGDERFIARLENPRLMGQPAGGVLLGDTGEARGRILENDVPGEIESGMKGDPDQIPAEDRDAVLIVDAPTGGSVGAWRLVGEVAWRSWGDSATGLLEGGEYGIAGNYEIEFAPVDGYIEPISEWISIPAGTTEPVVIEADNYAVEGTFGTPTGELTIIIGPDLIAEADGAGRGQWRMQGEGPDDWRDSGVSIEVPQGRRLVEFRDVDEWSTPDPVAITVGSSPTMVSVRYLISARISGARLTEPLDYADTTAAVGAAAANRAPYLFSGQIATDQGFGSGVVTHENAVLTAAHVVFDDLELAFVNEVYWFFQRHKGEYEPPAMVPRGWYVFEGYADQRALDVEDEAYGEGIGSPESQNDDAAVLYFLDVAGRGGFGGYQYSESTANPWLGGNGEKMLVGYPVDDTGEADKGRIHATMAEDDRYTLESDFVWSTRDVQSRPGSSGGGVYVWDGSYTDGDEPGGAFFPTAIYLGGTGETVVRAIDAGVVRLMNLAQQAGEGDGNGTGGKAVWVSPGETVAESSYGFVRVDVTGGIGGKWRMIDVEGLWTSDSYDSGTTVSLAPTTVYLELEDKSADGVSSPPRVAVEIKSSELKTVSMAYIESFDDWAERELGALTTWTGTDDDFDGDGLVHLLEYAFNLSPTDPGRPIVEEGSGTGGLPNIRVVGSDSDGLRVEFVRRKAAVAPHLSYRIESSLDLLPSSGWTLFEGSEDVTSIDTTWERVVVVVTPPTTDPPSFFARARVEEDGE